MDRVVLEVALRDARTLRQEEVEGAVKLSMGKFLPSGYSTGTSGALYDFVVPLRRKKRGGINQFKVHDGLALRET